MARVEVESEVTGNVWKVEVEVGDSVEEGDVLLILESMKMEIPVAAPVGGRLVEIQVAEDDVVGEGDVVAVLES